MLAFVVAFSLFSRKARLEYLDTQQELTERVGPLNIFYTVVEVKTLPARAWGH